MSSGVYGRSAEQPTSEERRSRHDLGRRDVAAQKSRRYTIGRTGRRQITLAPFTFWAGIAGITLMTLWSAGTASYFAFRDDLLKHLITRQADMQYVYEDRVADLRAQVDRLSSRQLLDQEQVERRVEQLARRQAKLEGRASTLSGLTDTAPPALPAPRTAPASQRNDPANAKPSPINDTIIIAPAPDRRAALESRVVRRSVAVAPPQGLAATLGRIEESLDRIESQQSAILLAMEDKYQAKAHRIHGVLADLGVDASKTSSAAAAPAPSGVGGPFIPVGTKADAFEIQVNRIATMRTHIERLNRALNTVPVRKPLNGEIDTTSGFGVRLDPFLRAPAMHSGIDFRATTGELVRATAAGKVTASGWNGGYGRMIEIDHGNGFSTRYAHLSEILVREDQTIRPGQIIGRVGSTGRSTGPHLHYETRIDGEAVDPHKFLRAGLRLGEKF